MSLRNSLLERCAFPEAEHVYCAVSGGADSLALLVLAVASGKQVTAVHVDHGLRPTSASDAKVVAEAAQRYGAQFVAEKVVIEPGPNLEARARLARYQVLPDGALTGHTADDQAETVLLNLMRGAGLRGLGGINPQYRPLINLRRSETHELCTAEGLQPVQDETNLSDEFRRNRVRHELLPLMDVIVERDVAAIIARQTESLREDEALLDQLATSIDPTDARVVAEAPKPLAVRALRAWLLAVSDEEQHPVSSATIARVLSVARGEAVACEVGDGWSVKRSSQRLRLERQSH